MIRDPIDCAAIRHMCALISIGNRGKSLNSGSCSPIGGVAANEDSGVVEDDVEEEEDTEDGLPASTFWEAMMLVYSLCSSSYSKSR